MIDVYGKIYVETYQPLKLSHSLQLCAYDTFDLPKQIL